MNKQLKKGDRVRFITTYPGYESQTVEGIVMHVGSSRLPCNPTVWTDFGSHEVLIEDLEILE